MTSFDERPDAQKIEDRVDTLVEKLTNWARHMAARYNGTVYLVGSVLHNPEPRDVDIRIVIHDHEFAARYGMEMKPCNEPPTETRLGRTAKIHWNEDGPTQRWVDDIAKFSAELSTMLKRNFDIKVWPDSYWREPYPRPLVLAAPSPRWFIYNKYVPDPTVRAEE